jgi:hypothetical protein
MRTTKHWIGMCACVVASTFGCSSSPSVDGNLGNSSGAASNSSGSSSASGGVQSGGASSGSGSGSAASGNRSGSSGGSVSGGSSSGTPHSGSGSTSSGSASASGSGSSANSDSGAPDPNVLTFQTVQTTIMPGQETVLCQDFANPLTQDVAVLESDSTMSQGSHHMFVFSDSSIASQNTTNVASCSGVEFHDFVHVAQTPTQVVQYPSGVGKKLSTGQGLRILTHYLNPGSTTLTGQVTINLHWAPLASVQRVAVGLFLNNALLSVPTGMSTQSRTTTALTDDIDVVIAVSHMHKSAIGFQATTDSGQLIYMGTQWSDPVPTYFKPAMTIKAGSTITWACTYNNNTGMALSFGESAATNEMCILAGVVYPVQAGVDLGTSLQSLL